MKKIRCFLAAIALAATLSGFSLQGMGSIANAASSQHASAVSSSFTVGQSMRTIALRIKPPCDAEWDC